jgi:hypothetical protein
MLGCVAGAALFCFVAPEYGYDPVPFFAVFFYAVTGTIRIFYWIVRRLAARN